MAPRHRPAPLRRGGNHVARVFPRVAVYQRVSPDSIGDPYGGWKRYSMAGKSHRSRPWHDQLGLVIEGRQPTMMVNQEGSRTTPSVVAFAKDGQRLVGQIVCQRHASGHRAERFLFHGACSRSTPSKRTARAAACSIKPATHGFDEYHQADTEMRWPSIVRACSGFAGTGPSTT